ncbi:MAG: sialate O-acetylesterase [Planctomycetes bacterium]|nr:sialate O-acetylesterase [Planctomycetota bacterium]
MIARRYPRLRTALFGLTILAMSAATALAELKLPAMFTSGAVLQQGIAVPVWGWADAGDDVTVAFAGQTKTTKAGTDGKWLVRLDALKVNKQAAVMTVASGDEQLKVENVLVGEVWFCSGQSNMEWTVGGAIVPDSVDPDQLPMIRHIKVPHVRVGEPADDFNGAWQVCSAATARGFTAVGFFFAVHLEEELDVPIGLIGCNWGGTRIEPWTPPEGFEQVDELDASKLGDTSTMYNGMAAAVQPYAIAGALWYQGESNGGEGESYYQKMKALVLGWRTTWDQGEFPFYFVQLANFQNPNPDPAGGDGWARLREAQLKTIRQVPKTGMAVITDVGAAKNIHPRNKYDVGRRLALWALANDYGKKDLVYSGPLYKAMKVEAGKVQLSFDHVGTGLIAAKKESADGIEAPQPVGKLEGFAIAGTDKKWVWADAVVDGATVVVSSPDVKEPVAVRYAFSMNPDKANLYNKEGLPASPFRTDAW